MSDMPDIMVSREAELRQLREQLEQFRLVALVGPGGVGKTTLARQLVDSDGDNYPGGIHLIDGYAISGDFEGRAGPLLTGLGTPGGRARTLVLIDGFDELAPRVADELLQHAAHSRPNVRVLLTSRKPIPLVEATLRLEALDDSTVRKLLARYGLSSQDAALLGAELGGHPLATSIAGSLVRQGRFTPRELLSRLREFDVSGVMPPDGTPLTVQERPSDALRVEVAGINDQLLRRLDEDIGLARELPSRKFEELVAELFARQGYAVELTPASKDGGKDIYVARRDDLGAFLYLVECKRYALDNPVGVEIVRALHGTVQVERATAGIIVTTSVFTKGAREFQRHVQYQLSLRDYAELHRWIRKVLYRGGNA